MHTIYERARNYIARIHSTTGNGGHASAYSAASALVRGFDLPEDSALELLRGWNQTNAAPPWSESDLIHKIREAAKSDHPAGYLLAKDKMASYSPPPPRPSPQTPVVDEAARKAAQREEWPAFRLGTVGELRTLASLRGIGAGIAWTAQQAGLLRFTTSRTGEVCYVLTEGTLAQVRRLDGQPFTKPDGTTLKSKNLPGSVGKWLGYQWLEKHPTAPVLIVEGLVAWMEAAEAIVRSDPPQWQPFASLSASVKLEARELALLANRKIIIAMDADETGAIAAIERQAALATIGITAAIWIPPDGCKDIGDALALPDFDTNSIFNHS